MTYCESANKWVEGMAVREELSVISRLIWEIVYSVGQEILRLSGKSQGISETLTGCGNHWSDYHCFKPKSINTSLGFHSYEVFLFPLSDF